MYRILYLLLPGLLLACESEQADVSRAPTTAALETLAVRTVTVGNPSAAPAAIQTTGVLTSKSVAKPSFKIGGVVARMDVAEGDRVRKGQRLATLDPTEIKSGRAQAQLAVDKAERDAQRVANLYRDSVATRRQLDDSRTAVDLARRQLESIDFNVSYTVARAPVAGRVVQKLVNQGEIVGPGQPVCIIQGTAAADWRVRVALTDTEWSSVRNGGTAELTFDAYPDLVISARITDLATAADPAGGTFSAELTPRLPPAVRPAAGLVARVRLPLDASSDDSLLLIPLTALAEADSREAVVFVVDADDRVARRVVRIGALNGTEVIVRDGLSPGERIVTEGAGWLRDGDRVRVVD